MSERVCLLLNAITDFIIKLKDRCNIRGNPECTLFFPLLIIPLRHPFSQNLLGLRGKRKGGRDFSGDEAPDLCAWAYVLQMCEGKEEVLANGFPSSFLHSPSPQNTACRSVTFP